MNSEQSEAIARIVSSTPEERAYRVTIIDIDGSVADIILHREMGEVSDTLSNYHDADGVVILVEVL